LSGDVYRLAARAIGESDFSPALFPDLTIPLADIWV
jgi:hypothetical protein